MTDLSNIPIKQTGDLVSAAEFNLIVSAIRELQPIPALAQSTLTAGTATQTSIPLTWTAVANATNYILKEGATILYSGAALAFNHTGLTAATSHNYTLISQGAGYTDSSATTTASTAAIPALDQTNLSLDVATDSSIKMNWTAVAHATNYILKEGVTVLYSGVNLTFTQTGLQSGSFHTYTLISQGAGYADSSVNYTAHALQTEVDYGWTDHDVYTALQTADTLTYQRNVMINWNQDIPMDLHDIPTYSMPFVRLKTGQTLKNFYIDSGNTSFGFDSIPGSNCRQFTIRGFDYYTWYTPQNFDTGTNSTVTLKTQ